MNGPLSDVCCASIPAAALPLLAALRTSAKVRARRVGDRVWLRWPAGEEDILRCVLPIQGAEAFARRDGQWFRPGRHLPVFDIPDDAESQTLLHLLAPAPFEAESRPALPLRSIRLRLVRDDRPRRTSALECWAADVLRWADTATTFSLAAVEVAACKDRVLLLGERLPPLVGAARFWGRTVFLPLGFQPEPNLPESALRDALDLMSDEVVFIREDRVEVVNRGVFRPATRAGIRRAWGVTAP